MFGIKEKKKSEEELLTVIDKGASFEGKMTYKGIVRIDGEFIGDLNVEGELVVGESGKVVSNLNIDKIRISGKVEGNIKCNSLVLTDKADLKGNITCIKLEIHEGALFNGNCEITKDTEQKSSVEVHKKEKEYSHNYVEVNG